MKKRNPIFIIFNFFFLSNRTEYVIRPITFDVSDFKRRQSLEETLTPSENVKRKAGEVPFQSDIEFNGNSIIKINTKNLLHRLI